MSTRNIVNFDHVPLGEKRLAISEERGDETLALPESSRLIIALACGGVAVGTVCVATHEHAGLWLLLAAVLASGFFAERFTGLAHFGFDYVWPDRMPILGPIAREFRNHHDRPTLDPSNYVVNFSKGAYASFPLSIVIVGASLVVEETPLSFFLLCTAVGMSYWALFFHQIHSYAHMGSHLAPEEFNRRVAEISAYPTKKEQIAAFDRLFRDEPIPPLIRRLQDWRIILNPGVHNLHHIKFETDFSSVNGWSDPVANLFFAPIARRLKARKENQADNGT